MIVNLTENRFMQLIQKTKLVNWDWLGIRYGAQRKPSSKNVQLWQYLAMELSFMFEFQLVSLAFSPFLGDRFMVPPTQKYGYLSLKKTFHGGKIYGGIVLYDGTNEEESHKMHFPEI